MKCVIFDLDGVIINSENAYRDLQKKICSINNINTKGIDWKSFGGHSSIDIFYIILHKSEKIKMTPSSLNRQFNKNIENGDFVKKINLYKNSIKTIERLKKDGLLIGLVTSSNSSFVKLILRKYAINKCFDLIVTGDEVKNKKPSPEPYRLLLKRAGLRPSDCIAIEDSRIGILSAKKAKILSIGINNKKDIGADISIKKITELMELIYENDIINKN